MPPADIDSLFASAPADSADLKILIAAMPKAGNVWLETLLSNAYGIPRKFLPAEFSADDINDLGPCWVSHQHVLPTSHLLRMLKDRGVIVATICRHPADVLVSFRNYLKNFPENRGEVELAARMLEDGDEFGPQTLHYVRNHFAIHVSLSLIWMRVGAKSIRYEDLRADTAGVLTALTDSIIPVGFDKIRAAVVLTSIKRLRKRHAEVSKHFRKGQSGEWRELLTPELVEVFRSEEPYPSMMSAMGYDMDSAAPAIQKGAVAADLDPFGGADRFENGVPLSDILVQLFMLHIPGAIERWPTPAVVGAGSYFAWLNLPCETDPNSGNAGLLVTNLAHELYKLRKDVREFVPDVFGEGRLDFLNWFLVHAPREYELDAAFFAPVFTTLGQAGGAFRFSGGSPPTPGGHIA